MSVEVTGRVWRESRSDGSELLVLLALADWADAEGVCRPSMGSLSEKARLQEGRVSRLVGALVGRGELAVLRGGGKGRFNVYWVRSGLPADAPAPWGRASWGTGLPGGKGVPEGGETDREAVMDDRGNEVEPSDENPGIRYPENLDRGVILLDARLRGLRGYEPDEAFFRKVAEVYCGGELNLEEQGIRIRGWFARHRRRLCTTGFVLTWLYLELHPERGYRAAWGRVPGGEQGGWEEACAPPSASFRK